MLRGVSSSAHHACDLRPPVNIKQISVAAVAAIALLVVGIWWGGHPADLPAPVRDTLVVNAHGSTVDQALADVQAQYYLRLGAARLENAAIQGVVASLGDPYAAYQTPAQYRQFAKAPAPERFSGVGVVVVMGHGGLRIERVLPGSPAARGGLAAGELITGADGKSFAGRSAGFAEGVIRGRTGTPVTLAIMRGGHRFQARLVRALVSAPAVQLVSGSLRVVHGVKVAVIGLATFDVSGIHTVVAARLAQLLHAGARAIVLDLRDNGGGLVSEAQAVASLFLRRGLIVTTRGRAQPTERLYATGHPLAPTQPLAVLVDGNTASAAEIVTGALQDDHRAIVVGTHTYGKGVYQEVLPLANGGAIDVTVGEYFLPNGTNLGAGGVHRGHGIQPNVRVGAAVTADRDPALQTALALVAKKAS